MSISRSVTRRCPFRKGHVLKLRMFLVLLIRQLANANIEHCTLGYVESGIRNSMPKARCLCVPMISVHIRHSTLGGWEKLAIFSNSPGWYMWIELCMRKEGTVLDSRLWIFAPSTVMSLRSKLIVTGVFAKGFCLTKISTNVGKKVEEKYTVWRSFQLAKPAETVNS